MSLVERLQLVVDATTGQAETRFQKLTGAARETGDAATRSANSVRDAADRVAAARDREATAAGALRVAEVRLETLRQSGRARADQIAAAEERVAGAQRNLHLATQNTARATQDQTAAQQRATAQMDEGARSGGRLRGALDSIKEKAGGAALALGGAGLVAVLRGVGDGFATGARDAGQLANSMNATVEEAGAFLGLVGSLGLELSDLLEIQAEFAQKVSDNGDALRDLGVETDRNADGTVNWANTLVSFLEKLQGVEDATERNRLGFQFLGEEGYKQMSRLVSSGLSVREALEQVGTPFTQEDIAAAAEYDAAMMELTLTSDRAQQQLGRLLLPIISGLAEGLGDLAGIVEDIPLPLAAVTAAAITMGVTGWTPAALAGGRLTTVTAALTRQLQVYSYAAALAGRASATMGLAMGGAAAAGRGLTALVGGPWGVALIALGAAYTLITGGTEKFQESSRNAAAELERNRDQYESTAEGVEQLARRLADEAGFWEGLAASRRGAGEALEQSGYDWDPTGTIASMIGIADQLTGGELAAEGFAGEIKDAGAELGAFEVQGETVQIAQKALNDLIAEGTTSGAQFADAVRAAAEAEAAQTRTTDLAEAALAAYTATTRDAVETQLNLYRANLSLREGFIGVQQAVHEAAQVVDDLSTPWSEVEEAQLRVIGSVLDYASVNGDAAVAAARANGTIVDSLAEAQIRGAESIEALRETLNEPGLTDAARTQITTMIEELTAAQEAGDIEAILRLTGADETTSELDSATKDRDTQVKVETRGGPAVVAYLDRITKDRLTRIRVESRNGPAVDDYLDRLTRQRLAIIRVESRNGPAVDAYLDGLAEQSRVAYIDVRQRGGSAVGNALEAPLLRGAPGAYATAGMAYGAESVSVGQMTVVVQADSAGRLTQPSLAEAGRQVARQLRAHERTSGAGWRTRGRAG